MLSSRTVCPSGNQQLAAWPAGTDRVQIGKSPAVTSFEAAAEGKTFARTHARTTPTTANKLKNSSRYKSKLEAENLLADMKRNFVCTRPKKEEKKTK